VTLTVLQSGAHHVGVTRRKLYLDDLAARYSRPKSTVLSWRARGKLPPHDGTEADRGHVRPYWYAGSLSEFVPPTDAE
jgi:hypothetical protein